MSTFTCILVDVSESMSGCSGDGAKEEGDKWARFIFNVIDDFVKYDVSANSRVIAICFGSQCKEIFDAIRTIKQFPSNSNTDKFFKVCATDETIESVFQELEASGARTIRTWARKDIVSRAVSEYLARLILRKLRSDILFTKRFVFEYLPKACRDWDSLLPEAFPRPTVMGWDVFSGVLQGIQSVSSFTVSRFRQATVQDIRNVIGKSLLEDVTGESVLTVHEAADIIHGRVNERKLTTARAKDLLAVVEPFIYGKAPLYTALTEATNSLLIDYQNKRRLLFVLSDGVSSDSGDIDKIRHQLKGKDVTVASCYISTSRNVQPRKLHADAEDCWEDSAKFLFDLSSTIPTDLVTKAIFIKHGWKFDITSNETKLFMQVNDPENLKHVCDIARNAVCCQDALSYWLVSVSLDLYINDRNTGIKAPQQTYATCYANASAAVLHLAMHRVLGREGGYPDFTKLRDNLIKRHERYGADTFSVLREVCPLHRMRCKEKKVNGAMKAIACKRPVVAEFRLTNDEWETFKMFYEYHPNGILKKSDIDIGRRRSDARTYGHAVVLSSYNSDCLRLMNSWGEKWADNGFFRVENAEVLGLEFIDVFWTKDDLTQREKDYYRAHGSEVADNLLSSLKSLQMAEFTCPLCCSISSVKAFHGTVSRVRCPMCCHEFPTVDGEGNILALNIYLTLLSR